ncbi:hypothetical protein [Paenibacillus agricola]|uniref:LysM domain-containing protein n=1 Tax=Paenibacillus agricola TaxID=2716264 RepID=A0ABX0JG64_9BACL|nr:hypothetical protein [Paenibacillus agricola]NHN32816.1 hypothetical protein [Paenibacillus agricola]
MNMSPKMKKVLPITLGLSLVFASSAFAATPASQSTKQNQTQVNQNQNINQMNGNLDQLAANTSLQNVLGFSKEEINEKLGAGKSLSDLAKDKNVNPDKVRDTLLETNDKQLDVDFKAGKMTQDQYNQRKAGNKDQAQKYMDERKTPAMGGNYKLAAVAKLLDMDISKIIQKVKSGKDIDDISESIGIDDEKVTAAVLKVEKQKIADLVKQSWSGKNSMTAADKVYFEKSGYLENVADKLDMSESNFKEQLNKGKTIEVISKNQDVDLKGDVIASLEKLAKKAIEKEINKNGQYFQ